jgi:hypothetical protein
MFVDRHQRYSIENMVRVGKVMFDKSAGSWFAPSETSQILKELHNSNQNSPLRILIYNNEFEVTSAIEYLNCNNHDKKKEITRSYLKKNKAKLNCDSKIAIFPGMIVILVRIGLSAPQPEMLRSVIEVMKIGGFMGILGGRPGRAHYIVGFTENN